MIKSSSDDNIYSDVRVQQIQTRASAKIPPNSYSFIFITFQDALNLRFNSGNKNFENVENSQVQQDENNSKFVEETSDTYQLITKETYIVSDETLRTNSKVKDTSQENVYGPTFENRSSKQILNDTSFTEQYKETEDIQRVEYIDVNFKKINNKEKARKKTTVTPSKTNNENFTILEQSSVTEDSVANDSVKLKRKPKRRDKVTNVEEICKNIIEDELVIGTPLLSSTLCIENNTIFNSNQKSEGSEKETMQSTDKENELIPEVNIANSTESLHKQEQETTKINLPDTLALVKDTTQSTIPSSNNKLQDEERLDANSTDAEKCTVSESDNVLQKRTGKRQKKQNREKQKVCSLKFSDKTEIVPVQERNDESVEESQNTTNRLSAGSTARQKKEKQKKTSDFFLRNKDDENDAERTLNDKSMEQQLVNEEKSMSNHFSISSEDSHNERTLKVSEDSFRRKLMDKVSCKIKKVLTRNKSLGTLYDVDVNVNVKKIVDQNESINEEFSVSYKKKANSEKGKEQEVEEQVDQSTKEQKGQEEQLMLEENLDDIINEIILDQTENKKDQNEDNGDEEEKEEDEEREESKEEYVEIYRQLNHKKVKIPWPLPPLHNKTRMSAPPSKDDRKKIEASGLQIKSGRFTKLEDDKIKSNFEIYCKVHDVAPNPSAFLNLTDYRKNNKLLAPQKLNFFRFLAHDLDNRTLYSVYKRFQRLFSKEKRKSGRFSKKEDEIIRKYMQDTDSQQPYVRLGEMLKRDPSAVWKRYQKLLETTKKKNEKFQLGRKQVETFLKLLVNVTGSSSIKELERRQVTIEEWKQLSTKMNVSVERLKSFWLHQIYQRLFIRKETEMRKIKQKLLDVLLYEDKNDWRELNWDRISKKFKGLTSSYLRRMLKNMVKYYVPNDKRENLKECLECLHENYMKGKTYRGRIIEKMDLDEFDLRANSPSSSSETTT